jgi:NTP pyrophosphatase (non-canonical NTP hydrolase)
MFISGKSMNFNEYQQKSRKTAKYPAIGHPVIYPTLGLVNEAGEVAGKIKKVFRDKGGEVNEETKSALKAELGDVLWYLTQVSTELGLSLDEVAEYNIQKLYSRLERGKIRGDGDNR